MSNSVYARYLRVCKLWPVDTTKQGRDFGEHLRSQVTKWFPNGELTSSVSLDCERNVAALERLVSNANTKKSNDNQLMLNSGFSSASGFKRAELSVLMSTEYLKANKSKNEKKLLDSLKETLNMQMPSDLQKP
jgi:hypothetical protein